jgi:Tic22-like family
MRHLGLGLAIGLVSSAVLAVQPAHALTDAQIIEKLQGIPVIALTDKSGAPLVAPLNDKQKGLFTEVYLGQKEVNITLQKLKASNPAVAKQLQIRVVTLGDVYKSQVTNAGDKKLNILVIPSEAQVKSAIGLLKKSDPTKAQQFNGVPLFVGIAGKPRGYVSINSTQEKKRIIPVFFDKEQLQIVLDKFKKDQPTLAPTTEIQVISLDGLLTQMRAKNEPFYGQIVLARPREMAEYVTSPAGQAKPATESKPTTESKPAAPVKPAAKPSATKK